jgi:TolA-binding protein
MNRLIPFLFSGLILLVTAASLPAQSKPAADANSAAYETYSLGDYTAAAAAYEKLLKEYPTDGIVPNAQIQLAFCYYFLAEFDKSSAMLAKAAAGPPLPSELKEIVEGMFPQILSAKAAAMPDTDPKRKTTFEEAITKFGEYLKAYPKAQDFESLLFSRAVAEYQIQKFDDVIKDLEQNLKQFPSSSTIASSKNLLAITLATQGSQELSKGDAADKATAFALYKRATDYLREIIKSQKDIALINEADFQLGEILMNQAATSPEAERPPLYAEALNAFRAVAPQEQILALQEEKLKSFPALKRQALQSRNVALKKQLDRDNERELKKLAELRGKPDQTATALLKMAEIFFQQGNLNAARVVLKHVSPFLTTDVDKKRDIYFTTMTYALQNAADRAPDGYTKFQSLYKGDPLADNLPFAMGNMYLGINNPAEAVRYFDESLAIYPKGRFAGLSVVSKASAETRIGKQEDAMKTFQTFLAQNPPPEIGVIAQSGLAGIYKDTQKWDEAIAAYEVTREKYPDTPQATEANYWIAVCTQQKGDNAAALPLLGAFVTANPQSPFAPLALYMKGGAEIALDQKTEGIATLTAVAENYPDSQPAPFTYFTLAQIAGSEGKSDEVVALMKKFIEKYPTDNKVYFAYEAIAQTALNAGKTDDALGAYREYIQHDPDSPQAGEALYKVAEIQRAKAESLGRYTALNDEERSNWKTLMDGSVASSEEMIKKYPDSPSLALNLQVLLKSQRMLLGAEAITAEQVEEYFQAQADAVPQPDAKSKIIFTLAAYVAEQDKDRALALMNEAYNAETLYSPQDLDFYGLALLDQQKPDEALAVFEKIETDYPVPPGFVPAQTSPVVQEAQATALFGKGRIAQSKGQTAEAGKYFEQLKTIYPWSPKVLEANFGIAQSLKEQNKLDEAMVLLGAIIREQNSTAKLRANSMLLYGDILVEKMNAATDPEGKEAFLASAIDSYIKIAEYYEGVPAAAAEGLWKGGELLIQQAGAATDPKIKARQLKRAKGAFEQLLKEYPNSEFAPKAKEQLAAMGGE